MLLLFCIVYLYICGTRFQIVNLRLITEKAREFGQTLFMCFIDYKKAFDMVSHNQLWISMIDMGFPLHIIDQIRSLYRKQQSAVRSAAGMTEWFKIGRGVRQGCILSPCLFNLYAEPAMKEALDGYVSDRRQSDQQPAICRRCGTHRHFTR